MMTTTTTNELYTDDIFQYDPLELKEPDQAARDSNGIFDEVDDE